MKPRICRGKTSSQPLRFERQLTKGIYNLVIYLDKGRDITIGKLGTFCCRRGFYVYTGSSQNSLQKRIERHLSAEKILRWHIDYLLRYSMVVEVITFEASMRDECKLSDKIGLLPGAEIIINGFGASDCVCKTHLYFFKKFPEIGTIKMALKVCG